MFALYRRLLRGLSALCAVLAAASLVAIMFAVLAGAAGRLLGVVVPGANAIAGNLVAAVTFLALAPTLRAQRHIRVELLVSRLPPRPRRCVEIGCLAVALALTSYLAYCGVAQVVSSYQLRVIAPGLLPIPAWIPQTCMAFGVIVLALTLAEFLMARLAGASSTTPPDE